MAGPTVASKDGKRAEQKAVVKAVWMVDLMVAWWVGLTVEYLVGTRAAVMAGNLVELWVAM